MRQPDQAEPGRIIIATKAAWLLAVTATGAAAICGTAPADRPLAPPADVISVEKREAVARAVRDLPPA
jgi:hypothetical protein